MERVRGKGGRHVVEADPWLTEARLVAAHHSLQAAQAAERRYLATAFESVKEAEARRIDVVRIVIATFARCYR